MMTKPPGFASSSTLPMDDEDEESIDESLDEILLEANERPLEGSIKSLEAVPVSLSDGGMDDVMDEADEDSEPRSSAAAMALKGMTQGALSEITVIAPRPIFADEEVREEETKVDPYETAIRAAATREGRGALNNQATQQRERALRKSPAPSVAMPAPTRTVSPHAASRVEFEEPDAGGDDADFDSSSPYGQGERTPTDIPISEDEESAPTHSGYVSASASANHSSGGFQPRLPPPRTSPPPGRPDIYPGRRIPTPSSDFLPPPPASTYGSGSHYPSISIPAPTAAEVIPRTRTDLGDRRLRLPAPALIGFLVTAFGGGILVGAMLWRGLLASAPIDLPPVVSHRTPTVSVEPVQPIVKPVVAEAPTSAAPAPAPAPVAPAPAAEAPSVPTMAAEASKPASTAPTAAASGDPSASKPSSKRTAAPKTRTIEEDEALAAEPAPPPKPAKSSKKKPVVWQDPFAQ